MAIEHKTDKESFRLTPGSMTFIALVIVILSAFGSAVAYAVSTNSQVEHLEQKQTIMDDKVMTLENQFNSIDKKTAAIDQKLTDVSLDIHEIKTDVKTLILKK